MTTGVIELAQMNLANSLTEHANQAMRLEQRWIHLMGVSQIEAHFCVG
jgi:hypothetical protein